MSKKFHTTAASGLVLSIGFALLLTGCRSVADEDTNAEKAIEALGGQVVRSPDASGRPIIVVSFANTKGRNVTDAGLKELARLKSLQTLFLSETNVTDTGMKELAGLKSLQTLILDGTKVTDAGLKELAGLKSLQGLNLTGTKVTDAGLKELAGLKSLQSLLLLDMKVTDAGVAELRKALPNCKITR
jgi:Leucine-rich repeat (LRR) protein